MIILGIVGLVFSLIVAGVAVNLLSGAVEDIANARLPTQRRRLVILFVIAFAFGLPSAYLTLISLSSGTPAAQESSPTAALVSTIPAQQSTVIKQVTMMPTQIAQPTKTDLPMPTHTPSVSLKPRVIGVVWQYSDEVDDSEAQKKDFAESSGIHSVIPNTARVINAWISLEFPSTWDKQQTEFTVQLFHNNEPLLSPVTPICNGIGDCSLPAGIKSPNGFEIGIYEYRVYLPGGELLDGEVSEVEVVNRATFGQIRLLPCQKPSIDSCPHLVRDLARSDVQNYGTRYIWFVFDFAHLQIGDKWSAKLIKSDDKSLVWSREYSIVRFSKNNKAENDSRSPFLIQLTGKANLVSWVLNSVAYKSDESVLEKGRYELTLEKDDKVEQRRFFSIQ